MRPDFVERVVDEQVFTRGVLTLKPAEVEALQLPAHPATATLEHRDGEIETQWQPARRQLGGEALLDLIEVSVQVDGLIRLHPPEASGTIGIQFLDRPATGPRRYQGAIEIVQPQRAASSKSKRPSSGLNAGGRALERHRIRDRSDFEWTGSVGIAKEGVRSLRQNLESAGWDEPELLDLRVEGERLAAISGFDELLALEIANVDHMPHQEATALKVLGRLRGRAILADEVGLGKTIEAGLILKELILRGMATRVLIACPATLREQWQAELEEKFHEEFEVVTSGTDPMDGDKLIISRQLAVREVDRLAKGRWDILIVDEAHRMSGANARKSRDFLQRLESRFALYLTATPVQNDLLELYRLVDTLRPGTFRSQRDFKRRFIGTTPREPKDPAALRRLVSDVMVRTTRAQAGLDRISRIPKDYPITLSKPERRAYDLCVDTLRRHMRGTNDHLRRRHLAHRLTTSPRALGQSARKMSRNAADPGLAQILDELADLCADFGVTSRQKKLIELVTEWVGAKDKGRVLVFTQHTDTLEDLLRVLAAHGIDAAPFHGGMTPAAKQQSIQRFRAGTGKGVPVMVSTDSGAEGLNLQFANCVVNYDLPWNPMRIEQRIGRVHRVTQTRDVYVANFFARNTIDESVYRLLHDKLRMFELLFGQVTTILGELDDEGAAATSFETRVLDALVAEDDKLMEGRLDALGAKIDSAYESAQHQMDTGAGNLSSLVFDTAHRKDITTGGARELAPEVVQREENRRLSVEHFVRRYLDAIGAEVIWDSPGSESDAGFLTATVPVDVRDDLGGRDELNLAFGGDAMSQHADAELCTVGTEIFEQIVDSLADRGDLVARVPDETRLQTETAWFGASQGCRFVRRELEPITSWAGEAVWRVRTTNDRASDQVITTSHNAIDEVHHTRPLGHGEALPAPSVGRILDQMVGTSKARLAEIAELVQDEVDDASHTEQNRLHDYFEARIAELEDERRRASSWSDRVQELSGQIVRLENERGRVASQAPPSAEVEADLIALSLTAPPVVAIREIWEAGSESFTIRYRWDMRSAPPTTFDGEDSRKVATVARCGDAHIVDVSGLRPCAGCARDRCGACPGGIEFEPCRLCGTELCADCVADGTCVGCGNPESESDGAALRLGHGARAQVGHLSVVLTRSNGDEVLIASTAGQPIVHTPEYQWLTRLLGSEVGIEAGPDATFDLPEGEIEIDVKAVQECYVLPVAESRVDLDAVASLWPALSNHAEREHLTAWADGVIAQSGLNPAPSLVVGTALQVLSLAVADGSLVIRRRTVHSDGIEHVADAPMSFSVDAKELSAHGVTLGIRRLNRSFEAKVGRKRLVISDGTATPADDFAFAAVLSENGVGDGLVVGPRPDADVILAQPNSTVELLDRSVETTWAVRPSTDETPLSTWPSGLASARTPRHLVVSAPSTHSLLNASLPDPPTVALEARHLIRETWRSSDGERSLEREIGTGESALPVLDDTGTPAPEFGIDADGHFHEVGRVWKCPSCRKARCRACGTDGELAGCPLCAQEACGYCRGSGDGEVTGRCVVCERSSCSGCGHDPRLSVCILCQRTACEGCLDAGACKTCRSLRPATNEERLALPAELVASGGGLVLICADTDASIVVVRSRHRLEIAAVTDRSIVAWHTASDLPDHELRLLLTAGSCIAGACDLEIVTETIPRPSSAADSHVLADDPREVLRVRVHHVQTDEFETLEEFNLHDSKPRSRRELIEAASQALGAVDRVPDRCTFEQGSALSVLAESFSSTSDPLPLIVHATTRERSISLRSAGVVLTSGIGRETHEEVLEWEPSVDQAEWRDLLPATAIEAAGSDDHRAALLAAGPYRLVAIRSRSKFTLHRLDDQPFYPDLVNVADFLETGNSVIEVVASVVPDDEPKIRVVNGSLEQRTWTAIVREAPDDAAPNESALQNLAAAVPERTLGTLVDAVEGQLPDRLREALNDRSNAIAKPDLRPVLVGFRAKEVWSTPAGNAVLNYERQPADLRASIESSTGRVLGPILVADRAAHLADSVTTCPYCSTDTCDACADKTSSCPLCGELICGRCRPPNLGVCPACSSAERVGPLARRRVDGRPSIALRGRDQIHAVLIVPTGGGVARVSVERNGATRELTGRVPAAVAAHFDRLTKSTAFT